MLEVYMYLNVLSIAQPMLSDEINRVAAHTDEISDILKSRIFHSDTATVSNFTPIYTDIHEKSQPSLEIY